MGNVSLEMRVILLEEKSMWNESAIIKLDKKVDRLQEGQIRILEMLGDYKSSTDERISSLQAHTDERISSLQAHTDARFIEVHKELGNIQKSIAIQTRWILSVILFTSIIGPVVLKLLDRYL